jgi:glyoxylate carboligase
MTTTARVVGHISLPAQSTQQPTAKKAPRMPNLATVASQDEAQKPIIRLPSGAVRAIASMRIIPNTNMVEVRTVPDLMDGGVSRTLRVPLNTPLVGFVK